MRSENRKKYNLVGLVSIWIIIISLFSFFKNSNEDKIFKLVNNNLNLLNECVVNETYNKIYELKGIKRITPYSLSDNEFYIDFYCHGFGIVPSSIYYGFYYISNDEPIGFQAVSVKLISDGDGWNWREANGDNWYYTNKIADHWYYYEAGF